MYHFKTVFRVFIAILIINLETVSIASNLQDVPPPPIPTAKAATGIGPTSFTANWGSSTGATKYYLDVAKNSSFTSYVSGYQNLDVGNVTSRGVTGLSAATIYYYRVRAANSSGTSGNSGTITVTTLSAIPPAPVAKAATGIGPTSFTANWGSSTGATKYYLDVAKNSSFTSYVSGYQNLDVGNVTSRGVTGLSAATTYYYRVRAANSSGTSGNSGTITVTTQSAIPPAPVASAATSIAQTTFTANWGSSTGATKYYLDVAKNSSFTSYVSGYQNLDVGNVTSRGVTGLSAATIYYYRVRAANSSGTSGNSGTITVTTSSAIPPPPSLITVSNITQTSFRLSWVSSTGATKYYLDVAKNSSFTSYVSPYQNLDVGNVTSKDVMGLTAGTTYYVRLRAANSSGTSGNSSTITVTTLSAIPPPPVPNAATNITQTSFTANWVSSTGATKYYLDVAKNSSFTSYVSGYQNLDVGNVTSRGVTGLSAATTYYYRVRAANSSGTSGSSGIITVTTQSAIPPAPVASAATSIAQTTFTANWGSSTGATKYYLDVAKNSSFTSYVSGYQNLDVGNVTSRGVTGLSAATTYYYRIRAANSSGTSGNSGTITVTTQSAIPVPPTSISVSGITQGGFIVSWGAVSGATGYFVDVATNSSFTSYVPGFNNLEIFYNLTTVTVRGLDPQKTYYFRIRSKNSYGISQNSSTSPVTTSPATYGVTILVHGYVLEGMEDAQSSERKNSSTNTAYDPVSYWGTNNIVGIQQRMGGGLVYKYYKQSLSFVNITDIVSAFKVNKNANGEKILIFDWSESSNDNASYHAEAAAEALFLALVKGNFVYISPQSTNPKIHFISHSRGTVVTSECVQRLGYYNVPVNYVTYLDPHDFDENWIPFDDFFHDPAVQVWDNIRYADNFWQLASGIIGGTLNPSGRSIEQLVSGYNYNRQLDDLNGFGNNGSHGLVKDYYFGTVIPGSKDNTWYTDKTGANTGLSLWLSLGGHSYTGNANCFNPSLPRTNAKTLANLIRYTTNSTNNDDDFAKPSISNSGFFSPDQGIPNSSNNIGGWSYFGGGYYSNSVTPALKFENGAMAFDCSSLTPTGSTYELTHNWVQVPYYNCNLSFQYKISRASSTLNSCKVKVYLITQENTQVLLWELALNSTTSWVTKTFSMSAYLNKRIKIKLVYVKESSTVTAARVEFDNFDIVGLSMDNDLVLHEILDEVLPEGSLTQPDRSLKKSNNLLDKEISEPEEAIKKNGIDKNNANPPDLKGSDMSSKIELESLHSRVESAPVSFLLHQNYPNPFNPVTTIKYTIPEDGFVSLRIFTPEGVEIANLVSDIQRAGEHTVLFNASNLPSGVYFYKLESGTKSFVKKLMLLK